MKKNSLFRMFVNVITTIIVIILMTLVALLVLVRYFGYTPYPVMSDSMALEYPVGSIVYVEKTDIEDIKIDDPITYVLNEDLVVATHRVVEIDYENKLFMTKGDANNVNNEDPVFHKNILGVVKHSLPLLGFVYIYIASKKGITLVVTIVSLLIITLLINIITDNKKQKSISF